MHEIIFVTIIGAPITAGILLCLHRSGRQPAVLVGARRRISPSFAFRAFAVVVLLLSLFMAYAATQARHDQLLMAILVSSTFLWMSTFLINQAFLARLEYDPKFLYYWTVLGGERQILWNEIQNLAYSSFMKSHYIQTRQVRRIWLSPWMKGNLEVKLIFLLRFFWQSIERAYRLEPQHVARRTRNLMTDLGKQPSERVNGFFAVFEVTMRSANTWLLRGAAELIRPGCTDEDFERFRATLISCGIADFSSISATPDLLADERFEQIDWFDGSLVEAMQEHERRQGMADKAATNSGLSTLTGETWTAADLPRLLPRLAERCTKKSGLVPDSSVPSAARAGE